MNEKEIENLVKKFQKGITSPKGNQVLEQLETNAEKKVINQVFSSQPDEHQTKHSIWNAIRRKTVPISVAFPKKRFWYVAVASILMIVCAGTYLYFQDTSKLPPIIITNHKKKPMTVDFIDGTKVTLNENAKISYTDLYNREQREVSLAGEAFFQVAKNKRKPFIIRTGQLHTRVVGTEFNIKELDSNVQVTVTQGAVKVYHKMDTLSVYPDNQVNFNKSTRKLTKRQIKSYLSNLWLKKDIYLNDVTFRELAVVIESFYQYTLILGNSEFESKRLSIALDRKESIDKVIKRINYISDVQLIKKQNNVIEVTPDLNE